jgi:hypothetical protein
MRIEEKIEKWRQEVQSMSLADMWVLTLMVAYTITTVTSIVAGKIVWSVLILSILAAAMVTYHTKGKRHGA